MLIREIKSKWLIYLSDNLKYSQNTVLAYSSDFAIFIKFLTTYYNSEISVSEFANIDKTALRSFASNLSSKKYEAASRTRIIASIRSFVKFAKMHDYLAEDFQLTIKNPKLEKKLAPALNENEIKNILELHLENNNHWSNYRDLTIFLLMYGCGLRISEAINLSKNDIYENHLLITGKGNKQRIVPLLGICKKHLNDYITKCPYDTDNTLFYGVKGNKLNPRIIQRNIAKLRNILLLPEKTTPHSLRHSYATHLLNNGANLREIQELLGHKNLSTTERYTKISSSKLLTSYKQKHLRN